MHMIKRIEHTCKDLETERDRFYSCIAEFTGGQIEAGTKLAEIWDNLILWAWADPACKYELNKGFAFIGTVGTSKSVTLKALAKYLAAGNFWLQHTSEALAAKTRLPAGRVFTMRNKINIITESTLREWYLLDNNPYGDKVGLEYNINKPVPIAVDEVGAAAKYFNHYGNKVNLFAELFNRRADLNYFTHFTSNLNIEQLHRHFDEQEHMVEPVPRFRSRLAAAVNVIDFTDVYDLRGTIKQF